MTRKSPSRSHKAEEQDKVGTPKRQATGHAPLTQTGAVPPGLLRRTAGHPWPATPGTILRLQRLVGNRAVGRFIAQDNAPANALGRTSTPGASPIPTATIQRKREENEFPDHKVHRKTYGQLDDVYDEALRWTRDKEPLFLREDKPLERGTSAIETYYHQGLRPTEHKGDKPKKELTKKGKYYHKLLKGRKTYVESEGSPEYETLTNPKAKQFVIPQVFSRGAPIKASAILWRMYKDAVSKAQKAGCSFFGTPKLEDLNEIVMQDIANYNTTEVAWMCFDDDQELQAGKTWTYEQDECKALLGSDLGKIVFWMVINYSKMLKGKRVKGVEAKGGGRKDFPRVDYVKFTLG